MRGDDMWDLGWVEVGWRWFWGVGLAFSCVCHFSIARFGVLHFPRLKSHD